MTASGKNEPGRFSLGPMGGLDATVGVEDIRERIGQVKADQKARGRYLGGKVPFGFQRGDDGELIPHEAEQEANSRNGGFAAQGKTDQGHCRGGASRKRSHEGVAGVLRAADRQSRVKGASAANRKRAGLGSGLVTTLRVPQPLVLAELPEPQTSRQSRRGSRLCPLRPRSGGRSHRHRADRVRRRGRPGRSCEPP